MWGGPLAVHKLHEALPLACPAVSTEHDLLCPPLPFFFVPSPPICLVPSPPLCIGAHSLHTRTYATVNQMLDMITLGHSASIPVARFQLAITIVLRIIISHVRIAITHFKYHFTAYEVSTWCSLSPGLKGPKPLRMMLSMSASCAR